MNVHYYNKHMIMKDKHNVLTSSLPFWIAPLWPLVLLSALLAHAEHTARTELLQGYHGRDNQSCCGLNDCIEATVALLDQGDTESSVMIGEHVVTLPNAWLHPSPDLGGRGWWCYVAPATPVGKSPTYVDQDGNIRTIPPAVPTRENSRCVFFTSTS